MDAFTRDDFIDILRRNCDATWLDGLLEAPDSTALLEGFFAICVQASQSAIDGCNTALISAAPGGNPGSCAVTFSRPSLNAGATIDIPAGYLFKAENGAQLRLAAAVHVAAGPLTFALTLQSVRQSEVVDTFAADAFTDGITGSAATDPSMAVILDSASNAAFGPPGTTVYTLVDSSTPLFGANSDWLSVLGNERGQQRQAGEDVGLYRLRVRNIADAVSPLAISVAVNGVAQSVGLDPVMFLEPFDSGVSQALRDLYNFGVFGSTVHPGSPFVEGPLFSSGSTPVGSSAMEDFFDDPGRLVVSNREVTAYFELDTPGVIFDSTGYQYFSDVSYFDDPVFGYADVTQDPPLTAGLMAIWEEANRKRAAAVQFDILLPLWQIHAGRGTTTANVETSVLTLAPSSGNGWYLVDGEIGHDFNFVDDATTPLASFYHRVKFTFEDTSTLTTPAYTHRDGQQLLLEDLLLLGFPVGLRITQVELIVKSDGTVTCGGYLLLRTLDSPL